MSERHWVRREIWGPVGWVVTNDRHRGPYDDIGQAYSRAGLCDSFNNPNERHTVWTEAWGEPAACDCSPVSGLHPDCAEHGMTSNALEVCSCGYPDGSFACKIRHIHLNAGDAKASLDGQVAPSRKRGIEVTG
jgi:hypothetical protein